MEQNAAPSFNKDGEETDPLGASQGSPSNPSYAEITKKNLADNSYSSEDETFERPSKRAGRKSYKEVREEEAERLKMQGSQPKIEMSIRRNTRARLPKGGVINPSPGK